MRVNSLRLGLLLCIMIAGVGLSFSQSSYYWGDGKKLSLLEDRSSVAIQFHSEGIAEQLASTREAGITLQIHPLKSRVIASFSQNLSDPSEAIRLLGLNPSEVKSISFAQMLDDGFQLYLTHHIALELGKGKSLVDLDAVLRQYGARYLRTDYVAEIIEVDNIDNVLPLANYLQENRLAAWATPDWYGQISRYQDPLYSQQFQMNNTGQTIDGFSGTNDMDCNAPEAWAISTGSSSITVAVIDDGMEAHEDLVTSGGSSRLLAGYTPANNGNGTPNADGAHGQACSGIIAASHNGIGVQGVAPDVYLRSVNIFAGGESTTDLANAISWAKNNGADVMSNSWGYTSCTFTSTVLTNAINDANNTGRGGLGCVIIFASGNGYKTCVDYPANLAAVVAVGAFGNDGIKSDYSNAGSALDIAAPSNDVSSAGFLSGAGVRTIDRPGSAGYDAGNYTTSFGGTSAACPVVAGVAALVLSVDGSLTSTAAKNLLYSTAIDMGSSGFDTSYGNGRVNAFAAVTAAGGGGGGGGGCTSTVSSFPYSESFESGEGWTQGTGDDMDWTRRSGTTPSSGTGPSAADDGTFYMYMEASSPNYPSKNATFESPCYDLTGVTNPEFSFSYHMLGSAVGTLALQASTDGTSWTSLWSQSGDQGSAWNSATIDLSAYSSASELRLRFSGTTGTSWQGDMCVDGMSLSASGGGGGGGCTDNEVTLTIVLDNYPEETSWQILDGATVVASGGTYGSQPDGSTVVETACLPDGCYDFVISDVYGDGICCSYGNGSYTLTDGGGTLASGGSFGSSETTNFCVGSGGGTSCPEIDFNSYTINAYGNGQDGGTSAVQDAGATLFIQNNAWKSISYAYTVTANTVIEFDFRSTIQGEIHGIGFDSDNAISSNRTFKVHGTQNWGLTNYDNYSGTAWTTYQIPVGSFYTGSFDRLFFVGDHDGGASNGNAYFRNVKIYEGACTSSAMPTLYTSGPIEAQLGDEAEFGLTTYPSPASDVLTVELSGMSDVPVVLSDLHGRVVWRGTVGTKIDIDVSAFAKGVYLLQATVSSEMRLVEKVVITE